MAKPSAPELKVDVTPDGYSYHPWTEFQKSGLLWLINSTIWYPRGYAMMSVYSDDDYTNCVGYKVTGDGTKPWVMPHDLREINEAFRKFKALYP